MSQPDQSNEKKDAAATAINAEHDKVAEHDKAVEQHETNLVDFESDELAQLDELSQTDHPTPKLKELLQSPDSPSRFMTLLSLAFGVLACASFILLFTLYIQARRAHHKPVAHEEKVQYQPSVTLDLGEFKLFIKSKDEKTEERELRVQIVAECTDDEVCDTIKARLTEARDLVSLVLVGTVQEDWMSVEPKNVIRKNISDRLNTMKFPEKHKVIQVHFTNMTIEEGKIGG